jgi:hypothetical protein
VSASIFIEGGESKEDKIRCRKAFRKLLEKLGFSGRLPALVACGSRNSTYSDFRTAHAQRSPRSFVAMLIDSEDPIQNIEQVWTHLSARDHWDRPDEAVDEQVLLMTTCMETWIVADRKALRLHYGAKLQESALPILQNIENRDRHDIQDGLIRATRDCSNAYRKGKRSFEVLEKVGPEALRMLPSFSRAEGILMKKLKKCYSEQQFIT